MKSLVTGLIMLSSLSLASECLQARRSIHDVPPDLGRWIAHYARSFGLDAMLLQALVFHESRYCPDAVGPETRTGERAIGLGQLMAGTAADLGIDPFDPRANLWAAAKYLRRQHDEFGDWPLALAAYNAGPGNVRAHGGIPPFEETRNYVEAVLRFYEQLTH